MELSDIISVSATISTAGISELSFGEPLIYGQVPLALIPASARTQRVSTSTWQTTLTGLGFNEADPIYQAASILARQTPRVRTFKIGCGRLDYTFSTRLTCVATPATDTVSLTVTAEDPAAAGTMLSVDVSIPGTGVANTNAANLNAALVATAFDPASAVFTNTGAPSAVIDVTTTAPGQNGMVYFSNLHNLTIEDQQGNRGIDADLNAILAVDPDFYEIVPADAFGETELTLIGAWAQAATNKSCSLATADSEVVAGTGIGDTLRAANSQKSTLVHTRGPLIEYPNAARSGLFLSRAPGTYIESNKELSGVTPSVYTTAEQALLDADFVNTYQGLAVGGVTVATGNYWKGWCSASSESFSDTYRLVDASVFRIQQYVINLLRGGWKLPMTDQGLSAIRGAVIQALKSFGSQAFVLSSIECEVPAAADLTAAQRAARTVPNVVASVQFAGGIAGASIDLTLVY